jgi:hypothetical protein
MKEILISMRNKIRPLKTLQNVVYHQDQNIRKRNKEVSSVKGMVMGEGGWIETGMKMQGNEYQGKKAGRICTGVLISP